MTCGDMTNGAPIIGLYSVLGVTFKYGGTQHILCFNGTLPTQVCSSIELFLVRIRSTVAFDGKRRNIVSRTKIARVSSDLCH